MIAIRLATPFMFRTQQRRLYALARQPLLYMPLHEEHRKAVYRTMKQELIGRPQCARRERHMDVPNHRNERT